MQRETSTYCPLVKGPCKQWGCSWFTQIRGTDNNTGKEVDEWACAITLIPMLLIENSNQQRQTGAAVESFRNEMVKSNANLGLQLIKNVLSEPHIPMIEVKDE